MNRIIAVLLLTSLCGPMLCTAAPPPLKAYGVAAIEKITQTHEPTAEWRAGRVAIECARNESESFQVVARASRPVENLLVSLEDLRAAGGAVLPAACISVRKVEWVDVNAPFDPAEASKHPNFLPDPLPPVDAAKDRFRVGQGENLVFWLTVTVPEAARAGIYRGRVRLLDGSGTLATVAVELRVRGFALPNRPILQSMVGLASANIYKAHGCKTREDKERIIRAYFDEYIRARMSPFLYAPSTMAFSPLPDAAIKWEFVKGPDGKPTGEAKLDFTGFDREGERYFNQRQAFSAFNFAPYLWTRRVKDGKKEGIYLRFADAKGTSVERRGADGTVNPVFDRLVVSVFRQIAAHLAEKGWLDRAIYYVTDEPPESDMEVLKDICRLIRQADPRIRTALTYDPANRPKLAELVEDGKSLISVWVPYCTLYREDVAVAERKKGADYWLYDVKDFCLISHSGMINRAMFWDVWRRNANGYLYYLATYWGQATTPWERPNFLLPGVTYKYRHGDGYFFYPPLRRGEPEQPVFDRIVPTVRWELMREGAEDYDCLRMLERLVDAADKNHSSAAAKGRRALARAHEFADTIAGAGSNYTIQMLQLEKSEGWSWSATESWLASRGSKPSKLKVTIKTGLKDGLYELSLRVYDDLSHHGRSYSRFLVNDAPYASPGTDVKGPVAVPAGRVAVRDGICSFELSSLAGDNGVIVYGAGLREASKAKPRGIYEVRHDVLDAIELLQGAARR
ncbi:MAG: glycoside hydrolase domain-containing protein [Verrucomicrobiia bacterium]